MYVKCDENMVIFHDSRWTEEAIYNILDNALKYTEPGGTISIETQRQELFYKISIADTGKGIAPERQAAIFTRFYREPEVHDKPGVGIGLYLARKIVEHDENGDWQMIFGVNTIPAYRRKGYAGELLKCAIEDARVKGRKGLVLTCKEKLISYYSRFGFVSEGISESVHGNVVWYQMRLTL